MGTIFWVAKKKQNLKAANKELSLLSLLSFKKAACDKKRNVLYFVFRSKTNNHN